MICQLADSRSRFEYGIYQLIFPFCHLDDFFDQTCSNLIFDFGNPATASQLHLCPCLKRAPPGNSRLSNDWMITHWLASKGGSFSHRTISASGMTAAFVTTPDC